MSEVRHPLKAIAVTVIYLVISVVLVWLAVTVIKSGGSELDFLFNDTRIYIIATGIPMSALAGATSYFDKSEKQRMIAGIFAALSMAFYVFFVLRSLDLGWQEEEFVYRIMPSGFLILFMIAIALKGVNHIFEYYAYRKEKISPPETEEQVYGQQVFPVSQDDSSSDISSDQSEQDLMASTFYRTLRLEDS